MNNSRTPVKATGQKADRRELRYQKLVVTIERTQRKVDKADRIFQRGSRQLVKLERQRQRLLKAMAAPKPEPQPIETEQHPRIEAKEEAVANALVEDAPVPPKPKRTRKAKPEIGWVFPQAKSDSETREARMKSLGFRKYTGKGRSAAT